MDVKCRFAAHISVHNGVLSIRFGTAETGKARECARKLS